MASNRRKTTLIDRIDEDGQYFSSLCLLDMLDVLGASRFEADHLATDIRLSLGDQHEACDRCGEVVLDCVCRDYERDIFDSLNSDD